MPHGSRDIDQTHHRGNTRREVSDAVVEEEPLALELDGKPLAVTMRTPGHDVELAVGFALSENIVDEPGVVLTAAHCDAGENTVALRTEPGSPHVHPPETRHFFASSSCGVCGKATIDAVRTHTPDVTRDPVRVARRVLAALPDRLRAEQRIFADTGSIHAAGLFEADGELVCVREDVGRHNAVDKLLGWAALAGRWPLSGHVLVVSGRCGFEIVQKALAGSIPLLAAISGPSTLAVDLARESGMTLVGFLRGLDMNVYSRADRIV